MTNAAQLSPLQPKRRSIRIPLTVRVTIRLPNDSEMECETVLLSRYGAKLRLRAFSRPLVSGDHVQVCLRGTHTWRPARIAWIDTFAGAFAVELQDPENFWGVHFPEKAEMATASRYTPLALRTWR